MGDSEKQVICPHCGAESPRSVLITVCKQCLRPLADVGPPRRPSAEETPAVTDSRRPEVSRGSLPLPKVRPPPRLNPLVWVGVTFGTPPGCLWAFFGGAAFGFAMLCLSWDLPKELFGKDTGWQVRVPSSGDPEVVWIFGALFVVALWGVLSLLCHGAGHAYLLAVGCAAEGTVKSVADTRAGVTADAGGDSRWKVTYRLTVEFRDADGEQHELAAQCAGHSQPEPGQRELVLYNPRKPESAVLLEGLRLALRVDEAGNIRPASPGALAASLIPAFLAIGFPYFMYRLLWTYGPLIWFTEP